MEKPVQITMLGKFTIYGPGLPRPRLISLTGRSRRLWILVVYLIMNRDRGVPARELIDWLWPDASGVNPVSTLQNNISRARNALEELGLEDGKRLIANTSGTYFWAPDRETELDCERFERLANEALDCGERERQFCWPRRLLRPILATFCRTARMNPGSGSRRKSTLLCTGSFVPREPAG